ncbi:MAG TPA: hypothetical protein VJ552_05845 [Sediminibacterium sp.]|nr:hypothetical protein [Sediminibacterium sp.]
MIGAGTGAVLVVGYIAYKHFFTKAKNKKAEEDLLLLPPPSTVTNTDTSTTSTPRNTGSNSNSNSTANTQISPSGFPLKKGSKGLLVKQLQNALIDKYGASVLPVYKNDGDWGSETENALVSHQYPSSFTKQDYEALVMPYLRSQGEKIRTSAQNDLYSTVRSHLQKLYTPADYTVAGEAFKAEDFMDGTKMTIVTGLLRKFTSATQQTELDEEFRRMGLTKDGNGIYHIPAGSGLSGVEEYNIVTVRPTSIWVDGFGSTLVSTGVMLGKAISVESGYVKILNNGHEILAPVQDMMIV